MLYEGCEKNNMKSNEKPITGRIVLSSDGLLYQMICWVLLGSSPYHPLLRLCGFDNRAHGFSELVQ